MGKNLSEQAKIASIQEKIKEVQSRARILGVGSFFSFLIAIVGFVLYFSPPPFGGWGPLALGIMGVIFFPLFSIAEWATNGTKKELMRELDSMSVKIPTCPKCGKELPKGKFDFCPFCGNSLTP